MPSPTLVKVDDRISSAAQQALQMLTTHKRGASFVFEVNPDELGLVNYFEIVTEPMCLDLVLQKLQVCAQRAQLCSSAHCYVQQKEYKNVGLLLRDVELVFKNAMVYNPPDDKVHKDAVYMCNSVWREKALAAFADAASLPVDALRSACVEYGRIPESVAGGSGADVGPTKRSRGREDSPPASVKKERAAAEEDVAGAKGGAFAIRLRLGANSPQPQLASYGAAALSEKLQSSCTAMLRTLQNHPRSELFLTPVDWKSLELDDYLTVIKNPMSLQEVRRVSHTLARSSI
jgi:hypothetical protein